MHIKAVIICLVFVGLVSCWGSDGHQIVGQIASNFLTSKTQTAVNKMLNGQTLASISTWPDSYDHSSQGSWSSHLHYANVYNNQTSFAYSNCEEPFADPAGCVVTAITNATDILAKNLKNNYWEQCTHTSDSSVPCQLSFLVHYIGDAHQPMHISYQSDKGGNSFSVEFNGGCTNLHSLWDSGLIKQYESSTHDSWQDIAENLSDWLDQNQNISSTWTSKVDPGIWANETFLISRNSCYNFSPGSVPPNTYWFIPLLEKINEKQLSSSSSSSCSNAPVLGNNYWQRTMPLVLEQLTRAGIRLASRLNSIYDANFMM